MLVHRAPDADTGVPGLIAGKGVERVLRATAEGEFVPMKVIGDIVEAGDVCGMVGEEPVKTTIAGVVRGMLAKGLHVTKGFKGILYSSLFIFALIFIDFYAFFFIEF